MQINSVEGSHIMMFARSIMMTISVLRRGLPRSTEAGGLSHPDICAVFNAIDPNYFLPKIEEWFGSGKEATSIKEGIFWGGGGGGLHAEQHFEYHRHIGPGDVLTAEVKPGKTWEKEGKRSGKLVFSETITEYRDQNGELAITARGVGVRTERPVDQ